MAESIRIALEVDDRGSGKVDKFTKDAKIAFFDLEKKVEGNFKGISQDADKALRAMRADLDKSVASVNKLEKELTQLRTKGTGPLNTGLGGVSKSALGATAALVGIGSASIVIGKVGKTVVDFDAAMREVSTLVDTSVVSMEKMTAELLNLPPILGSSTELAKGLYQALSAGIEPAAAVAFVGEAAKLAQAGLADTNTVVDLLTTTLNAYGLEASETGRISDVFFKTVEQGKTTLPELASSMGSVIPLASTLGIGIGDLSAAVATLTASGVRTDEAMTQLRGTFSSFISNADKFRALGIDLTDIIQNKGGLVPALNAIQEATGGDNEALQELLPNIRAFQGVLSLAGTQAETFAEKQKIISDSFGATAAALEKQQTSLRIQLSETANAFDRFINKQASSTSAWSSTIDKVNAQLSRLLGVESEASEVTRELADAQKILDIRTGAVATAFAKIPGVAGLMASGIEQAKDEVFLLETRLENIKAPADDFVDVLEDMNEEISEIRQPLRQVTEGIKDLKTALFLSKAEAEAMALAMERNNDEFQESGLGIDAAAVSLGRAEEAMRSFGVESDVSLRKAANTAVEQFNAIKDSGLVTGERLKQIYLDDVLPKIEAAYGESGAELVTITEKTNKKIVESVVQHKDELVIAYQNQTTEMGNEYAKLLPIVEKTNKKIVESAFETSRDFAVRVLGVDPNDLRGAGARNPRPGFRDANIAATEAASAAGGAGGGGSTGGLLGTGGSFGTVGDFNAFPNDLAGLQRELQKTIQAHSSISRVNTTGTRGLKDFLTERSVTKQRILAEKIIAAGGVPPNLVIPSGFEGFAGEFGARQKRQQNNPFSGGRAPEDAVRAFGGGTGGLFGGQGESRPVEISISQTFTGETSSQTADQIRRSSTELAEEINRLMRLNKVAV